jgi:hypothetical protein
MAVLSGRLGSIDFGTLTSIPATNISVNSKAEVVDTTNFTNQGFDSHAIGMYSAEITLDLLEVIGGYGLKQGQSGTVTINDGDPVTPGAVTITNCLITGINYDAAAKDVQKMSITLATKGAYSIIVG